MSQTPRYRIAENEWNLTGAPWRGATGIEEIGGNEDLAVPPVVAWFTRGEDQEALARRIVELLNGDRP